MVSPRNYVVNNHRQGHGSRPSLIVLILSMAFAGLQVAGAGETEIAGYDCGSVTVAGIDQQKLAARELLVHSYDRARLACAVHVLTEIASNNPADYEAQRQALEANAHYIYYLDRIILYELGYLIVWYVDQVPEEQLMSEPLIAMQVAQQQQQDILSRAHEAGMNNPELDYYAGLAMGPTLPALPLLKKAVAADPQTLKGAAHALLAETYYALPDIAGGDLDLAVSTMRTALVKDPSNPRYARLLAAYLIDLGAVDEARSNLARMVGMETGSGGLQIMADQLRIAADLAERINDANLSRQLSGRRDGLLEEHPELLKRIVVSAMGHFGDKDPMEDS